MNQALAEWWQAGFTDEDRNRILDVFHPLGAGRNDLLEGSNSASCKPSLSFLTDLSGWFTKDEDRQIGYKILAMAEQMLPTSLNVIDSHFFYQSKIEMHYRDRGDPHHLAEAENACRAQIAIAPLVAREFAKEFSGSLPEHKGYTQLAIILYMRGAIDKAIEVARRAQVEGWSGDWSRRIDRYSRK